MPRSRVRKRDVEPEKPSYRIPSMGEIRAVAGSTGLRVASTFSGAGGSCLGYAMAGYDVGWASEFVENARACYLANWPGATVDPRDVREVKVEEILESMGLERGELDVLDGSPPCDSFSTAGKRDKSWGKEKPYHGRVQRTDDLFFEYVRLVDGLNPRAFVAENVAGLVKGKAFGYFKTILAEMKEAGDGYRVKAFDLNAEWLGVPQRRRRIVFVGVRRDLGLEPVAPTPLRYRYSIADALPWLAEKSVIHDTRGNFKSEGEIAHRPAPTITSGMGGMNSCHFKVHPPPAESLLEGTALGREAAKLRPGQQSDKYFSLVRPRSTEPSPTITTKGSRGTASVIHPTEPRKFTVQELKRLFSFPDDYELVGKYREQWARMGLSVPPRMMAHVALSLRDHVFAPLGMVRDGARVAI